MRIVSTLAVILLHTCSALIDNAMIYELSVDQYYVLTDIVHLMTWTVPIFFMVSGALLIDEHKEITYSFIWKKYCKRIILALVIFGVPFSMMEIFVNTREISLLTFLHACLNLLTGDSWAHLWYLYTLIGLYLELPIVNVFLVKQKDKRVLCLRYYFLFSIF